MHFRTYVPHDKAFHGWRSTPTSTAPTSSCGPNSSRPRPWARPVSPSGSSTTAGTAKARSQLEGKMKESCFRLRIAGKSQLALVMIIIVSFMLLPAAFALPIVQEDFESTAIGSIPAGWYRQYNTNSSVTDATSYQGSQSLFMQASPYWGAVLYATYRC